VCPGELRSAEWAEIDLDAAEWRIPGNKMKMGLDHLVPPSMQAVEILRSMVPMTGHGKYVFPSIRTCLPRRRRARNLDLAGMDGDA
jgi:integrase